MPTLKAVYCVGVTRTPARAPSAALSAKESASMRDTGIPCSAAASRLMEQARIALPVLVDAKNQASPLITSAEQPKRWEIGKHWQCPRLIADRNQGRALDDDLRCKRRQDHDEHRRLPVPQRPHHNALQRNAEH